MEKYNEPQIYIANNEEIAARLGQNFNVATGNLGIKKVAVFNQYENTRYVALQYEMISNMHEYRVVILDLQNENEVQRCLKDDEPNNSSYLFELEYPKKEFLPTPLVLSIMQSELSKQCLKIIFAGKFYIEEYNMIEVIKQNHYSYSGVEKHSPYEIIGAVASSKYGKKIKSEGNILAEFIKRYTKEYKVVFDLPTSWDRVAQTLSPDSNFIPLLKNQDDEVVSYLGYTEEYGYEILLPVCEKKAEMVERLVTSVLPEILPDFFLNQKSLNGQRNKSFYPKRYLSLRKNGLQFKRNMMRKSSY